MKSLKIVAALFTLVSAPGFAQNPGPEDDNLELCVTDGACSIPVHAKEIEGTVFLVKSEADYHALSQLWTDANFFITTETDYAYVKAGRETFIIPAVNPSAEIMERAKGGGTPTPAPRPPIQGPLIGGSITVTVGGGAGCSDCHTGSWKEIHSGVMKPAKPDNGK